CAARCGYCDFNTYVAPDAERAGYAAVAVAELRLAARELDRLGARPAAVDTVFFGGGTPTLLGPAELGTVLAAIDAELGLAPGAEVTTEANPESVDAGSLAALREAGFTRVSFGMQSAAPHVLAVLDRVHTPGRAVDALREARAAGFEHVSADLIYGTPGESDDDWRASLDAALAAGPDHVSAYALTVEPGTALAARVRRGELPAPDDDVLADRYAIADERLGATGLRWYEVSNWAASDGARCRHNLGYWGDGDWWPIGPGAHGHLRGVRWWNVRRPADHARMVADGRLPEAGREVLADDERETERVMLGLRMADGLELRPDERAAAAALAADGLLEPGALAGGRAVLTLRGRLLGDHATRALLDAGPARRSGEASRVGLAGR
ncbi:MAG TPA: radical SAM family heme chaperone HemW, partial [Solirubrobacteraceae bacterium]|nr:radical SAM family heme chaperone HemW [Solirubrobacteraceae bacterium]